MGFLETVRDEYNLMRARSFADGGYEGVTHAGIALVASDTNRVFLTKRALDPTDAPDVAETWEFPGGGLKPGEEPFPGAVREVIEETGWGLPDDSMVTDGWRAPNGVYQGFVVSTMVEFPVDGWSPTTEVSDIGWFDRDAVASMQDVGALRPELATMDWSLVFGDTVSGNTGDEGDDMTDQVAETDETPDYSMVHPGVLYLHGVLAPEDTASGDSRGFNSGSATARPLRLPFGWQEWTAEGHNQSITVASIDRLMRKDGLIHWEGALMTSAKAEEFTDLLCFFGQYGVSIDGDKGSIDGEKSKAQGMVWFDAVRISGAVACSIPAFAEAYVALGPHPDMPADGTDAALSASGIAATDLIGARMESGLAFGRGPGYVTNPVATNRIHDYWTKPGKPGYIKVGWGTPGDFARAKALIGSEIAEHSPGKMRFLNQIIAQWHHDALGYWPSTHAKMVRDGLGGGAKTAAHAVGDIEASEEPAWEAVLTSSGGKIVRPPATYFQREETAENCVIEEPDENGLRRTYGYAGEWGVCHIGYDGRCVEVPEDPAGGTFPHFHLGRTKTAEGDYIRTGLITYGVEHRGAEQILAESPTQAHFDDLSRAWAAVRVGQDDRGIWFSGVVLPTVEEEWLVAIEASGQVSGEWKHGAMRTLLTVNVPGFPVVDASAAYDDEGHVIALAASAFNTTGCAPTPAERMEALRQVDAEERFAALRAQYLASVGA